MQLRLSIAIARALAGIGLVGFASVFVLSAFFMNHRPHTADLTRGFTCPFQQHGVVVYLTRRELFLMSWLPGTSISLFFAAIIVKARSIVNLHAAAG